MYLEKTYINKCDSVEYCRNLSNGEELSAGLLHYLSIATVGLHTNSEWNTLVSRDRITVQKPLQIIIH
jgi:hypothetical protein